MLSSLESILRSKYYPGVLQAFSVPALAVILFYAFTGNPHGDTNLGVASTWQIWWTLLPFSAVVLGRLWCSICPISTVSRTLLRFRGRTRRSGTAAATRHGVWASGALLVFLTWAMIAWRIESIPVATGGLLLVFLACAVALELVFGERVWCKFVCPIGTLIGLYSRLAPLQLRPREGTCAAKCGRARSCHAALTSRQCLHVGPVADLRSNRNCNLCGDCLKTCRHSSLALRFGWPEAFGIRAGATTAAEAAVLLLVASIVLVDLFRMTSWYPLFMRQMMAANPALDYNSVLGLAIAVLAVGLVALHAVAAWAGKKVTGRTWRDSFVLFAAPYVAVAAAVHLGSELFHLANHGTRPLLAIAMELGLGVDFPSVVRGAIYVQDLTLQALQVALVVAGTAVACRAMWKSSRTVYADGLRGGFALAPHGVVSIIIAGAAAFLFISPMGMIH